MASRLVSKYPDIPGRRGPTSANRTLKYLGTSVCVSMAPLSRLLSLFLLYSATPLKKLSAITASPTPTSSPSSSAAQELLQNSTMCLLAGSWSSPAPQFGASWRCAGGAPVVPVCQWFRVACVRSWVVNISVSDVSGSIPPEIGRVSMPSRQPSSLCVRQPHFAPPTQPRHGQLTRRNSSRNRCVVFFSSPRLSKCPREPAESAVPRAQRARAGRTSAF